MSGDAMSRRPGVQQDVLKFAEAALAESKREGLWLAVRARWVALRPQSERANKMQNSGENRAVRMNLHGQRKSPDRGVPAR